PAFTRPDTRTVRDDGLGNADAGNLPGTGPLLGRRYGFGTTVTVLLRNAHALPETCRVQRSRPRVSAVVFDAFIGFRSPIRTVAATRFLPECDVTDRHRPIGRLTHVIDRECRNGTRRERLHFDAGAVDGVDMGFDFDELVIDME